MSQQSSWSSDIERNEPEAYRNRGLSGAVWLPLYHDGNGTGRQTRRVARSERQGTRVSESNAANAAALAVATVVVATTAVFALSATEGARFVGQMRVPGDQPILLVHEDGSRAWQTLQGLEPRDLEGVKYGAVAGFEDGVWRGRRTPLHRAGWVYQTEFGSTSVQGFTGRESAPVGNVALGYMPGPSWGLLAGASAAFGSVPSEFGVESSSEEVFQTRAYVQAEWWPVSWSRLHLGPYAQAGRSWTLSDYDQRDSSRSGPFGTIGAALQIDWTTNLAVTLRVSSSLDPSLAARDTALGLDGYRLTPSVSLGLSVY